MTDGRDWRHITEWPGVYYDGKSPRKEDVMVTLSSDSLAIIRQNGSKLWWRYDQISQTQGHHSENNVYLEHAETEFASLIIKDVNFLKALNDASPGFENDLKLPLTKSRFVAAVLYSLIGITILLPVLYFWVIPAVSEFAAENMPLEWERGLGESYVELFAPDDELCEESGRKVKIDGILGRLLRAQPGSEYIYELRIVRDPDTVNAFALPGGYIAVFEGLLIHADTPEELAGVLAHEIQHVEHKHGLKQLAKHYSISFIISVMSGDVQGSTTILETAGFLSLLSYGRDAELEADRDGMELLRRASVDPQGMVDFFETIKDLYAVDSSDTSSSDGGSSGGAAAGDKSVAGQETVEVENSGEAADNKYDEDQGLFDYISTHPNTNERINYLKNLAADYTYDPVPLMTPEEWEDVKKICDY